MILNNIEYKENSLIANKFNNYFLDMIKEILDNIEVVQYANKIPVIYTSLKFHEISLQELLYM